MAAPGPREVSVQASAPGRRGVVAAPDSARDGAAAAAASTGTPHPPPMQGSASGGNQPRTVADEDWMYNPDNFGSTVRKVLTLKPRARAFFVYVVLHLLRPLFFIIQTVLLLVEAGRGTYRVRLTLPAVPHAWVVSAAVAHDTSDRGNKGKVIDAVVAGFGVLIAEDVKVDAMGKEARRGGGGTVVEFDTRGRWAVRADYGRLNLYMRPLTNLVLTCEAVMLPSRPRGGASGSSKRPVLSARFPSINHSFLDLQLDRARRDARKIPSDLERALIQVVLRHSDCPPKSRTFVALAINKRRCREIVATGGTQVAFWMLTQADLDAAAATVGEGGAQSRPAAATDEYDVYDAAVAAVAASAGRSLSVSASGGGGGGGSSGGVDPETVNPLSRTMAELSPSGGGGSTAPDAGASSLATRAARVQRQGSIASLFQIPRRLDVLDTPWGAVSGHLARASTHGALIASCCFLYAWLLYESEGCSVAEAGPCRITVGEFLNPLFAYMFLGVIDAYRTCLVPEWHQETFEAGTVSDAPRQVGVGGTAGAAVPPGAAAAGARGASAALQKAAHANAKLARVQRDIVARTLRHDWAAAWGAGSDDDESDGEEDSAAYDGALPPSASRQPAARSPSGTGASSGLSTSSNAARLLGAGHSKRPSRDDVERTADWYAAETWARLGSHTRLQLCGRRWAYPVFFLVLSLVVALAPSAARVSRYENACASQGQMFKAFVAAHRIADACERSLALADVDIYDAQLANRTVDLEVFACHVDPSTGHCDLSFDYSAADPERRLVDCADLARRHHVFPHRPPVASPTESADVARAVRNQWLANLETYRCGCNVVGVSPEDAQAPWWSIQPSLAIGGGTGAFADQGCSLDAARRGAPAAYINERDLHTATRMLSNARNCTSQADGMFVNMGLSAFTGTARTGPRLLMYFLLTVSAWVTYFIVVSRMTAMRQATLFRIELMRQLAAMLTKANVQSEELALFTKTKEALPKQLRSYMRLRTTDDFDKAANASANASARAASDTGEAARNGSGQQPSGQHQRSRNGPETPGGYLPVLVLRDWIPNCRTGDGGVVYKAPRTNQALGRFAMVRRIRTTLLPASTAHFQIHAGVVQLASVALLVVLMLSILVQFVRTATQASSGSDSSLAQFDEGSVGLLVGSVIVFTLLCWSLLLTHRANKLLLEPIHALERRVSAIREATAHALGHGDEARVATYREWEDRLLKYRDEVRATSPQHLLKLVGQTVDLGMVQRIVLLGLFVVAVRGSDVVGAASVSVGTRTLLRCVSQDFAARLFGVSADGDVNDKCAAEAAVEYTTLFHGCDAGAAAVASVSGLSVDLPGDDGEDSGPLTAGTGVNASTPGAEFGIIGSLCYLDDAAGQLVCE